MKSFKLKNINYSFAIIIAAFSIIFFFSPHKIVKAESYGRPLSFYGISVKSVSAGRSVVPMAISAVQYINGSYANKTQGSGSFSKVYVKTITVPGLIKESAPPTGNDDNNGGGASRGNYGGGSYSSATFNTTTYSGASYGTGGSSVPPTGNDDNNGGGASRGNYGGGSYSSATFNTTTYSGASYGTGGSSVPPTGNDNNNG